MGRGIKIVQDKKQEWVAMASTLKVPMDLKKEARGAVVAFMEKVEQGGRWPQQACTTVFFLIPKNVTSERPIALMPTSTRWWEALRAHEVAKWKQRYRVDWDATDGRNGGAQQSVNGVNSSKMERFKYQAGEKDQGAVALVLGLAKAFERVRLPVVWAWATHFSFPSTGGEYGGAAPGYHGHPTRVKACFNVLCCRLHWVMLQKFYPPLKLRVFVDDITALLMGKNKVVSEMAKKVMKKRREEVEKQDRKLSVR